LAVRIDAFEHAARREGIGVASRDRSPIRFIPVGDEQQTIELAASLLELGHYVNVAYYPAVPRRRAGVRVVLNNHQRPEDISRLVADIAAYRNLARTDQRPGAAASAG
jgi:7-keto-8-aminopelargonate synthetase-like enzyme